MFNRIYGMLEESIPIILLFLSGLVLSIVVNSRITLIIVGLILFFIGVLFLKSEAFHEKYVNLLFDNESYINYMNNGIKKIASEEMISLSMEVYTEKKRRETGLLYIIWSILLLLDSLTIPVCNGILNKDFLYALVNLIILLLNSIIGVYLFRKFRNNKQYIFSCFLFIAIIICYYALKLII